MAVILKEVDKIRSELGLKLLPPTADGREDDTEVRKFQCVLSVSYSINRCSLASLDTIGAVEIIGSELLSLYVYAGSWLHCSHDRLRLSSRVQASQRVPGQLRSSVFLSTELALSSRSLVQILTVTLSYENLHELICRWR